MSAVSNPGTHFVSGLGNEDVTAKLRSLGNGGIHEILWGRGDWPPDLDDAHGGEGRFRRSVDKDLRRSGRPLGSKALIARNETGLSGDAWGRQGRKTEGDGKRGCSIGARHQGALPWGSGCRTSGVPEYSIRSRPLCGLWVKRSTPARLTHALGSSHWRPPNT